MNQVLKISLIGAAILVGMWVAYWAHDGLWFLFNIAMSNPRFADAFVLVGAIVVLAGMWEIVVGRWLR